jgi:hypothetical protein
MSAAAAPSPKPIFLFSSYRALFVVGFIKGFLSKGDKIQGFSFTIW